MTAFQRLSTGPTLPDLIRREADRRAQRSLHMLPADVWLRQATIAVSWHHRNNGLLQRGSDHSGRPGRTHVPRPPTMDELPRHCSATIRTKAVARSSRAAMARSPARSALQPLQRRAGMAACFAGAQAVLAATRLLNRGGLLSQSGLGAALGAADRLTRAGMRLWRSGRPSRQD